MTRYFIPAREARIEMIVVNSRFIASAAPVFTVEAARAFVNAVKAEFSDASHNVPVFAIGRGNSVIAHCTDDGEPSGTAGRPALTVLQGSGIGDVAVVVTRYFGGTKLGTGGLVRAYGDAVREVLKVLPLAEKVPTQTLMLAVPYNLFERVRLLIKALHGETQDEDFAADVTIVVRLAASQVPLFQERLQELSAGRFEAEVMEVDDETIMPVGMVGADIL